MKRILKVAAITILGAYLGLGAVLYLMQDRLLYFPTDRAVHDFPTITMHTNGASLEVIVLNAGKDSAAMYFGGNGESMIGPASRLGPLLPDHSVYLVNYRGYAGSTGSPSEENLLSDARLIFDELARMHTAISVIGRSLGSGVAVMLASERQVEKLVLITPYDSIRSIAQARFPVYPMRLLLRDAFDSVSRAGSIMAETLVLVAETDRVIPRPHTDRLVQALSPPRITVEVIKNSNHNNISSIDRYYQSISGFLVDSGG